MVEHLTCNQGVRGSIPRGGTTDNSLELQGNPLPQAPFPMQRQLTVDKALAEYFERHLSGLKRPKERMSQLTRTLDKLMDPPRGVDPAIRSGCGPGPVERCDI